MITGDTNTTIIIVVAAGIFVLFIFIRMVLSGQSKSVPTPKTRLEELTIAIQLNPEDDLAYFERGKYYMKIGKNKLAISDFRKARKLGNTDAERYLENLDPAYGNKQVVETVINELKTEDEEVKKYREQLEDYNKAINNNPQNAIAYVMRGVLKETHRDYSGAMDDFIKAIEIKPEYAEAYLHLAKLKIKRNEIPEACLHLKKAKELGCTRADSLIEKYCNNSKNPS